MSQWTREITHALGFNERHAESGTGAALAFAFGATLQVPFSIFHANAATFAPEAAHAVSIAFFLAMAVFAGIVSYRRAEAYDYFRKPSCAVTWSLVCAVVAGAIPLLEAAQMANVVLLAIVGATLGVGLTAIFLFLAHLLTRTYIPDILKRAFAGAAFAILLEAMIIVRLPDPWGYVTCAVLLAVNTPILVVLLKNAPAIGDFAHFKS